MAKPDGSHEALPHSEHHPINERFWRIIVPEVNMPAFRALGNMISQGTLRQSSASRLFQDLWNDGNYFDTTSRSWRAKEDHDR